MPRIKLPSPFSELVRESHRLSAQLIALREQFPGCVFLNFPNHMEITSVSADTAGPVSDDLAAARFWRKDVSKYVSAFSRALELHVPESAVRVSALVLTMVVCQDSMSADQFINCFAADEQTLKGIPERKLLAEMAELRRRLNFAMAIREHKVVAASDKMLIDRGTLTDFLEERIPIPTIDTRNRMWKYVLSRHSADKSLS